MCVYVCVCLCVRLCFASICSKGGYWGNAANREEPAEEGRQHRKSRKRNRQLDKDESYDGMARDDPGEAGLLFR